MLASPLAALDPLLTYGPEGAASDGSWQLPRLRTSRLTLSLTQATCGVADAVPGDCMSFRCGADFASVMSIGVLYRCSSLKLDREHVMLF